MAHVKQKARKLTGGKPSFHHLATKATQQCGQQIGGMKKYHRYPPGMDSLREIHKFQKTTDLLIRKAPFRRLVRKLSQNIGKSNPRMQTTADLALQEAAEAFMIDVFSDTNLCAMHSKHVTITAKDMVLACRIQGIQMERA
jgi:histone H3